MAFLTPRLNDKTVVGTKNYFSILANKPVRIDSSIQSDRSLAFLDLDDGTIISYQDIFALQNPGQVKSSTPLLGVGSVEKYLIKHLDDWIVVGL